MQFVINIDNELNEAGFFLGGMSGRLNDLTPLMSAIGSHLENTTAERFLLKQSADGIRWANLLPQTQAKKGDNNMLVQSGDLMRSIASVADSDSVTVGVSEPYGAYHQQGTKHMAARPFLGISVDDENAIDALIAQFLEMRQNA